MRYGPTRRLLRVLRIIADAGICGITAARVQWRLHVLGIDVGLRTVQRDLEALADEPSTSVVRAIDPADGQPANALIYFFDRTGRKEFPR